MDCLEEDDGTQEADVYILRPENGTDETKADSDGSELQKKRKQRDRLIRKLPG